MSLAARPVAAARILFASLPAAPALALAALVAVLCFPPACALAAPSDVAVEMAVQRVVPDGRGGERQESAEQALPGDTIAYAVTCRNGGKKAVRSVRPVLPIPPGTAYLAGTADPSAFEASVDGKSFARPPLRRKARGKDGKEREVEVPPSEYRSLRWTLDTIPAGGAATVRARVKILEGPK